MTLEKAFARAGIGLGPHHPPPSICARPPGREGPKGRPPGGGACVCWRLWETKHLAQPAGSLPHTHTGCGAPHTRARKRGWLTLHAFGCPEASRRSRTICGVAVHAHACRRAGAVVDDFRFCSGRPRRNNDSALYCFMRSPLAGPDKSSGFSFDAAGSGKTGGGITHKTETVDRDGASVVQ